MNNIHGTPKPGHGGSDWRESYQCPDCGAMTTGALHPDGGRYVRCPDCINEYLKEVPWRKVRNRAATLTL